MTQGSVLDPKLPHGTGAGHSDSIGGGMRFGEDEK